MSLLSYIKFIISLEFNPPYLSIFCNFFSISSCLFFSWNAFFKMKAYSTILSLVCLLVSESAKILKSESEMNYLRFFMFWDKTEIYSSSFVRKLNFFSIMSLIYFADFFSGWVELWGPEQAHRRRSSWIHLSSSFMLSECEE